MYQIRKRWGSLVAVDTFSARFMKAIDRKNRLFAPLCWAIMSYNRRATLPLKFELIRTPNLTSFPNAITYIWLLISSATPIEDESKAEVMMIFQARSKLPKKRRRILQPHEIHSTVGKSTTAALLSTMNRRINHTTDSLMNAANDPNIGLTLTNQMHMKRMPPKML